MANNVSVVDQIVKSLSFEVEAVPQEDATKLTSTSNSTPLNVRIRVRKKQEYGMQQGYLSVPKFGHPDLNPERVRLISSDQTIMSFDVSMEADFVKKPKKKPRKLFFGGCLGTEYDDDKIPYTQNSTYNAKMTDTNSSSKSDGVIRQKFTLSKTKYDNTNALQQYTKKHSILGRCKPGGCLDPPFSEEKYSYEPQNGKDKIPRANEDPVKIKVKNKLTKADDGHRTCKESKQPSKDSITQKADDKSASILSIYDNSFKGSLDSKYSDSVITYPPLMSPSAVSNERNSRNRISTEEKPRRSYNDSIEAFYTSPKKSNRFNDRNSSGTDSNQKEKVKIIPIPVPIGTAPLGGDFISNSDKTPTEKLSDEDSVLTNEAVANITTKEKDKTNLLTRDDISTSKINDFHVTTPHIRDLTTSGEIDANDTENVKSKTGMTTPLVNDSTHMLDSNESYVKTPYTQDLEPPKENYTYDSDGKAKTVDSSSSCDPHSVKETFLANLDESNVFNQNQDLASTEKTGTNKTKKEADKTILPVTVPIPLVNDNTVSKSDKVYATTQHDKQHLSPKEPDIESDSAESIARKNKDIVSTDEPKLNQPDKHSSYTDNSVRRSKNTKYDDTTKTEINDDEDTSYNDINNKAIPAVPSTKLSKEAELILQSSPVGSMKIGIIDAPENNNDTISYSEPYGESTQILDELQNFNDEAITIQDQHENASHQSKKYGDLEESKLNVKTEVYDSYDENSEMTNYNITGENPNQNISKTDGEKSFIPEDQKAPLTIGDNGMNNNELVDGNSNEDVKRFQILTELNVNDENKEFDLQENEEDTFSDYDNNVPSNKTDFYQNSGPTKYNNLIKPVYEEYSKTNTDENDQNSTIISEFTQFTPSQHQHAIPKTESPQVEQFNVSDNDSISKQEKFDKESTHRASVRFSDQDEKPTDGVRNGFELLDSLTQSSKYELNDKPDATTDCKKVSEQSEKHSNVNSDYILPKSSNHKPNLPGSDSKASADKEYGTLEVSSKISLKRDSISLNLGFQSYINDRNERSLKTIDPSSDNIRYPDDSVTVIQSHLRPDANEIRIPIDSDNDLTIQIHRNKSPVQTTEQEPFDYNKSGLAAKRYGLPDTKNNENNLQVRNEKNYCSEIPTILNSVYEQELLPLQKTINYLKKEIDILASQQSILIEKIVNVKRNKPVRLLRINSRCACFR